MSFTVPSPRPADTTTASALSFSQPPLAISTSSSARSIPSSSPPTHSISTHARRPSLPAPTSLLSSSPSRSIPVPPRHGSILSTSSNHSASAHPHRLSFSGSPIEGSVSALPISARRTHTKGSSSGSVSLSSSLFLSPEQALRDPERWEGVSRSKSERRLSEARPHMSLVDIAQIKNMDDGKWLTISAGHVARHRKQEVKVVRGTMSMEEAVEVLLQSEGDCLLVERAPKVYGFFDYADLNTFLLLVLHASTSSPSTSRSPSRPATSREEAPDSLRADVLAANESALAEDDEMPFGLLDQRGQQVVQRLRRGHKVIVGDVCDISQKDPYHCFNFDTTLRTVLPLFASGVHRIAVNVRPDPSGSASPQAPRILTDLALLEHLVSLPAAAQPTILTLPVSSPAITFPLHPLVSLPGTASVLDAMQVMSLNGLSALGVLSGSGSARSRRESSGSSGSSTGSFFARRDSMSHLPVTSSPMLMPLSPSVEAPSPLESSDSAPGGGGLFSIVTAQDCAKLVVPSEGKQVLGMGLEQMVKGMQYVEEAGRERGEERVPVHTIPYSSTLVHASHLILATSSSRVFLRNPGLGMSPPLSPTPSLTTSQYSPPSSPSISALYLSEQMPLPERLSQPRPRGTSALPPAPPTQLSPHYVVSTVDILSALAKAYSQHLTPPPGATWPVAGAITIGTPTRTSEPVIMTAEDDAHAPSTVEGLSRGMGRLNIGVGDTSVGGGFQGWELDPEGLSKRRRASSAGMASAPSPNASQGEAPFESWRWAGRVGRT